MNREQREYIEKYIDLIDNDEWEEFFWHAPKGTGGVLYESGIEFLSKLTTVPFFCFYESNLKEITLPENIKVIEKYAFYSCDKLTSITLSENLTVIEEGAFCYCSKLETINMFENIESIERCALNGPVNLTINFDGTKNEFKNIKRGRSWTVSATVLCSDGKLKFPR